MESYCNLQWNDYASTFSAYIADIFNKEIFSDTTIVCNGKHYLAHRLVLSLSSKYFEDIFSKIDSIQPFILIDDIEPEFLEKILEFMYSGKIFIDKSSISQFLKAANSLQVKGLCTETNDHYTKRNIIKKERPLFTKKYDCDFTGFTYRDNSTNSKNHVLKNNLTYLKENINSVMYKNTNLNNNELKETKKSVQNPFIYLERMSTDVIEQAVSGINVQTSNFTKNYDKNEDLHPYIIVQKSKDEDDKASSLRQTKQCIYCSFTTKSLLSMKRHVYDHKVPFKKSSKKFSKSASNIRNIYQGIPNRMKENIDTSLLVQNKLVNSKFSKIFKCKICNFTANSKSKVLKHKIIHKQKNEHKCVYCPFIAINKECLIKHELSHCSKYARKQKALQNSDAYGFSLLNLNKEYPNSSYFNDDKEISYKCNYCNFRANSKSIVTGHEIFHLNEEPYQCSFCPYKSSIKAMLKCHEMTH